MHRLRSEKIFPMTEKTFEHTLRIYWEDTDAGGIVYHANYLRYMERARGELLRAVGIGQRALAGEEGLVIVVAGAELSFRRSARLDDLLTVRSRIKSLRHASVIFQQDIFRGEELICSGLIRCGAVSAQNGRPIPLPENLINLFSPFVCETSK